MVSRFSTISRDVLLTRTRIGVISGITGAAGSFGGVIFTLVARYNGLHYAKTIWIMGIVTLVNNLVVLWIPPLPKGQLGGH